MRHQHLVLKFAVIAAHDPQMVELRELLSLEGHCMHRSP